MKAWLPILVEELQAGRNPILALAGVRNLARAAVFDGRGQLLGGGLGSPPLQALGRAEAARLAPGECRLINQQANLILERLPGTADSLSFWSSALENHKEAWASWLLTMPRPHGGPLTLTRHILSAFGPWTTPRLPEEFKDQWSLLPLKAGLGRLFVIGDDALAMETTALAARTGLTATWCTAADQSGRELDEARAMADFSLILLSGWDELTPRFLETAGLKEGVRVVVTVRDHESFIENIRAAKPAYLALAGEAESEPASGLFPEALTISHKALGLVAEMLSRPERGRRL
ncbi:MAG: hypothetical protein LBS31_08650 [Candidatus Adiutrix sp.]|jgi:hypothetical protein|nr:hypothetical protein [Candidatus Adiutrix sp.]